MRIFLYDFELGFRWLQSELLFELNGFYLVISWLLLVSALKGCRFLMDLLRFFLFFALLGAHFTLANGDFKDVCYEHKEVNGDHRRVQTNVGNAEVALQLWV